MLKVHNRQKNASAASTKAVILVSSSHAAIQNSSTHHLIPQVGGPSRGTRFRPLSLDVPKVSALLNERSNGPLNPPHSLTAPL